MGGTGGAGRAGRSVCLLPEELVRVWLASSQGQLPRQPGAPPHPPGAFHLLMIPESLQSLARWRLRPGTWRAGVGGGQAGTRPIPHLRNGPTVASKAATAPDRLRWVSRALLAQETAA